MANQQALSKPKTPFSIAITVLIAACSFELPRNAVIPADASIDSHEPDPALTCADASGSRIRHILRRTDDGTQQVVGQYDNDRQEECRWSKASDNTLRCMPIPGSVLRRDGYVAYQNSTCTDTILAEFVWFGDPNALFLAAEGRDWSFDSIRYECEGVLRVFKIGPAIQAPQSAWRKDPNGLCAPLDSDQLQRYNFYVAGAEIAPSIFAAGTKTMDGDARIQLESITGEDGSHSCGNPTNLRDSAFGASICDVMLAVDDELRCVPSGTNTITLYTDPSCTTATLATKAANCRSLSTMAREHTYSAECGHTTFTISNQGGATTALFERKYATGPCTPVSAGYTTYAVDSQRIPESSFSQARYIWSPTGSRLKRRELITGGLRVPTGEFRDEQLDIACEFQAGHDGILRCVPRETEDEIVIRDSPPVFTTPDCSGPPGAYVFDYWQLEKRAAIKLDRLDLRRLKIRQETQSMHDWAT